MKPPQFFGAGRSWRGLVVAGSLSILVSGGASEVTYTVEGHLHYEASRFNTSKDIDFTVCVSNCSWSITGIVLDGQGVVYKQVYDRGITSSAVRFPGNMSKRSTAGNNSVLGFENTDMPNPLSDIGPGQIWLAYCSACKFSVGTTGRMEPVWFIDTSLRKARFNTPACWKTEPDKPFLTVSVDYFFDSASKVETNVISGSYRATNFTRVGALRLPKEFVYEAFDPGDKQPLAYKYQGRLIKARLSIAKGAFDRGLGGKTLIADDRSSSNPSYYVIDDTTTAFEKLQWWVRDQTRWLWLRRKRSSTIPSNPPGGAVGNQPSASGTNAVSHAPGIAP